MASIDAIMALEAVLRSKGDVNKWEKEVLRSSMSRAGGNALLGASISFAAVWSSISTFSAIPRLPRFFISGYAGLQGAKWTCGKTLNTQIENLLSLDGTRIQSELATLILTDFKNEKSLVKLVRKHFFAEQVFGDLNPDVVNFRWRPRNYYADSGSNYNYSQNNKVDEETDKAESATTDMNQSNYAVENLGGDLFVDPLECLFGYVEEGSKEVVNESDVAPILTKRQIRAQKRANKIRKRESLDSDESS